MATKELALDVAIRPRPPAPRASADPAHTLVGPSPLNALPMPSAFERGAGLGSASATAPDVVSRARMSTALQQSVGNARSSTVSAESVKALASNPLPPVTRASPTPAKSATAPPPAGRVPPSPDATARPGEVPAPVQRAAAAAPAATRGPTPEPAKPGAVESPEKVEGAVEEAETAAATPQVAPAEAPIAGGEAGEKGAPSPKKGGKAEGTADAEKTAEGEKAPAKPSPREAVASTTGAVRKCAARAQKHSEPPDTPIRSAQAAAITKGTEQQRLAATATVAKLDDAKEGAKGLQRETFKTKFKEAIEAATPKPTTEADANKVVESGAKTASSTMKGQLATQRDEAAGTLKTAATGAEESPSSQPAPPAATLEPEPLGPKPAPVAPGPVVPEPLPPERLDYSADRAPTDGAMAENNVTKTQLEKGNDPAFGPTVEARSTAEQHEAEAEAKYRKSEAGVQARAETQAKGALAAGLGDIHGARATGVAQVIGRQVGTHAKDLAERQRVTETIDGIKTKTKTDVENILKEMETEAARIFGEGLTAAEKAYRDTFEEEKGGLGTWLTTWGDDWKELIESSLSKARLEYLYQVDLAIDKVAEVVDTKLNDAKSRVAAGRKEVDDFVEGLKGSVKQFGEDAAKTVSADFDGMSAEIDSRGDALVNTLVQQFKESHDRMSAMEEELRAANKSLWERVYDATIGLIKKILAFKDMLLSILAKATEVIVDIISDPIGFLGNLVSGVMLGLENFMGNISAHLKKGLMDWLFGALGGAGLQLPETLDLKGIVSIALQVLGLTYANFRARAVAIVGEPVVSTLEETAEVFKVIVTEGIPGIWRFIKEKLQDLQSMVLDAIFAFVEEKVIIAGITWLIGLLNPVSAFFKACKAIYDIVMFFIERGSQILALVNAIIDSMASIAKGNIAVAAKFVENALAKAIPVAIGFLASLLGLGDISGTIRKIIDKAQEPINKAIDWVIHQAVKLVKTVGKAIGGLFGTKKEKGEQKAAEGEEGHIAIAQEMGADLVDEDVSGGSPKEVMKRRAHELAPTYSKRLEPGVKLSVEFTDPPPDKADEEIDFTVVIAPNTTRVKFTKGLAGYLSPEAGAYSVLKAKEGRKNKDGTIQEAHHAPPVELANSLGSALVDAGDELADDYPDTSQLLGDAGAEFIAQAQGHGADLSAILLNEKTHRIRGGTGPRIHGSDIRKYLAKYLTGRKGKDVARTTKGEIAVKPGGAAFRSQISGVGRTVSKQDDLAVALRDHGPEIVSRVHASEEARSLGVVEVALSQSEVDGPAKDRRSAIATLRSIAKSTWGALVKAVKF